MIPTHRCTRCGAAAMREPGGMDPRYPLGQCLNQSRSCGRVPVLPPGPQLDRWRADQQRIGMRTRHNKAHMGPGGHLVASCPLCAELRLHLAT